MCDNSCMKIIYKLVVRKMGLKVDRIWCDVLSIDVMHIFLLGSTNIDTVTDTDTYKEYDIFEKN